MSCFRMQLNLACIHRRYLERSGRSDDRWLRVDKATKGIVVCTGSLKDVFAVQERWRDDAVPL